jgi:DNA-binding response OmpR family regulator
VNKRARPHVLIVEDAPLLGFDLEFILAEQGCAVVGPAGELQAAVDLVRTRKIDIALVDYVVGEISAAPLAKLLDEKAIPYALCTADRSHKVSLDFPNTPILQKPFQVEDVSNVIDALLAARLASI